VGAQRKERLGIDEYRPRGTLSVLAAPYAVRLTLYWAGFCIDEKVLSEAETERKKKQELHALFCEFERVSRFTSSFQILISTFFVVTLSQITLASFLVFSA
jgi:hypothetical protein